MESMTSAAETPATKKRIAWLAVLLGVVFVGLGQIYNGQLRKAILFWGVTYLLGACAFVLIAHPILPPFLNLLAVCAVAIAFWLYTIADALLVARRLGQGFHPRRYNKWYVYLILVLIFTCEVEPTRSYFARTYCVEAYKMPSGSMIPTLHVGDHLLRQ